jgi:hypothetical protein
MGDGLVRLRMTIPVVANTSKSSVVTRLKPSENMEFGTSTEPEEDLHPVFHAINKVYVTAGTTFKLTYVFLRWACLPVLKFECNLQKMESEQ